MSYSPLAHGFIVLAPSGTPVLEESHQGRYALIFLNRSDVIRYRQQACGVRQVSQQGYAIAAMPVHRLQRLLNLEKVRACIISNWETVVA